MSRLKLHYNGRHFWWRALASTIAGQAANTTIFMLTAWTGIMSVDFLLDVIWNGIVIKTLMEAILLPGTAFFVRMLKTLEKMDYFDR